MRVDTGSAVNCVTSEDILNHNGGLVLPRGVTLTEPLVQALLKQNISQIDVEEEEEDSENEAAEIDQTSLELKEHIDELFIRHRGPFMKEFQACLIQQLKTNN